MGPPDGRSLDGGNGYFGTYRRSIYDESTDKVFEWSLVSFKFLKGRCHMLLFASKTLRHSTLEDLNGSVICCWL